MVGVPVSEVVMPDETVPLGIVRVRCPSHCAVVAVVGEHIVSVVSRLHSTSPLAPWRPITSFTAMVGAAWEMSLFVLHGGGGLATGGSVMSWVAASAVVATNIIDTSSRTALRSAADIRKR